MEKNMKTKEVFDPEFLKIDLALTEGMSERILRRRKRGESTNRSRGVPAPSCLKPIL